MPYVYLDPLGKHSFPVCLDPIRSVSVGYRYCCLKAEARKLRAQKKIYIMDLVQIYIMVKTTSKIVIVILVSSRRYSQQ